MTTNCKACFGYGFWIWGHVAPMGRLDAKDGVPTARCPECGASANHSDSDASEVRYKQLKKLYDNNQLKFGEMSNVQEAWKLANAIV